MLRWAGHLAVVLALTALTQLGGLAWIGAVLMRRRWLFVVFYALLWGAAWVAAPMAGRVALPCTGDVLRMQSPVYCVAMRNFVTPEMALVAQGAAEAVARQYPGTVTLALDGGLPFLDGFPLLPHLSHDDGEKLDLAFYYADEAYAPGRSRSPIGYFAFEALDAPVCPPAWLTLRWDLRWLQPLWSASDLQVEEARTVALIHALETDARVAKIFVEPPLLQRWGLAGPKLRFQGCRAARHDDHVHVQL
ncbi:hypothetical protein [Sagittula sp. S175]|uniref:hypothetical protein n=1 Tax=Sagittula sp. S175 TaxID=3415129 RepID=UPI003C7A395B